MTVMLFTNIALTFTIAILFLFQQSSIWSLRCAFRREFIMLEGLHEISKGISSGDIEASAGALMEHFQRMAKELEWQNVNGWSIKHPFRLPELPNYTSLLSDTTP